MRNGHWQEAAPSNTKNSLCPSLPLGFSRDRTSCSWFDVWRRQQQFGAAPAVGALQSWRPLPSSQQHLQWLDLTLSLAILQLLVHLDDQILKLSALNRVGDVVLAQVKDIEILQSLVRLWSKV